MSPLPEYVEPKAPKRGVKLPKHAWILATVATLLFLYFYRPFSGLDVLDWTSNIMSGEQKPCHTTSHDASGWHSRASEFAGGTFEPKKEDVVLVSLINSQVEHDGFTLGLIKPNLAVDARGKILVIAADDFKAIEKLTEKAAELPKTGAFRGQWRVKHDRTGFPISRLLVPGKEEISVYGWDKNTKKLQTPVQGHEDLPDVLQTLFGWINEGRDGYVRGAQDAGPIKKVRDLVE